MFTMIRDLCIARNGFWSANIVAEIAYSLGYFGRRSDVLRAIKTACGTSEKRGGKRTPQLVPQLVPELVPGTSCERVPEKKKKKQKEKESYIPKLDTTYLAKGAENSAIEAEIVAWLDYQAEKRQGQFTLRSAQIAVSVIAATAAKHGNEFVIDALQKTIDKGADLGYFKAVAKSGPTGSRPSLFLSNGVANLTGSRHSENGYYFRPENGATISFSEAIRAKAQREKDNAANS
jgi:hypothetical protein